MKKHIVTWQFKSEKSRRYKDFDSKRDAENFAHGLKKYSWLNKKVRVEER